MKNTGLVKKLMISLVVMGAVTGVIGAGTFATFTAQKQVEDNFFTTGTVSLNIYEYEALPFAVSNMAPGDIEYGKVDIKNDGTLALKYGMTTTVAELPDNGLAGKLQLTIVTFEDPADDCDGTVNFSENVVYGKDNLDNAEIDQERVLASAAEETLCFRAELPLAVDNSYQEKTHKVDFIFDAVQTANNS